MEGGRGDEVKDRWRAQVAPRARSISYGVSTGQVRKLLLLFVLFGRDSRHSYAVVRGVYPESRSRFAVRSPSAREEWRTRVRSEPRSSQSPYLLSSPRRRMRAKETERGRRSFAVRREEEGWALPRPARGCACPSDRYTVVG